MNEVWKAIQNPEKKGSNVDEKFSMETDFEKNQVEILERKDSMERKKSKASSID